MAEATKGKWGIVKTKDISYPIRIGKVDSIDRIAEIYGYNYNEAEANARMIVATCSEHRAIRLAEAIKKIAKSQCDFISSDKETEESIFGLANEILEANKEAK